MALNQIQLTRGLVAVVDAEDFAELSQYNWQAHRDGARYYAVRTSVSAGKRTAVVMHRVITQAPPGAIVDHVNGDGLDNRVIAHEHG